MSVYNNYFFFQVSWIRHRDIHLLTVGRYTYTSDQRFEATHVVHTDDYALRIIFAQTRDAGTYECQIGTTPPIGYFVHLTIVGLYMIFIYSVWHCEKYRRNPLQSIVFIMIKQI